MLRNSSSTDNNLRRPSVFRAGWPSSGRHPALRRHRKAGWRSFRKDDAVRHEVSELLIKIRGPAPHRLEVFVELPLDLLGRSILYGALVNLKPNAEQTAVWFISQNCIDYKIIWIKAVFVMFNFLQIV